MMITVYGIKTCDTCRKAVKALNAAGLSAQLHDVRANPVSVEDLSRWVGAIGSDIVNRRSPSWRALDSAERSQADAESGIPGLLQEHPTVMKRPVIVADSVILLGWNDDTRSALGV
jgi:arsenate reductase